MVKTVTLLNRRVDLTPEQFHSYWRDVHGPLVLAIPGVRRYVQCRPFTVTDAAPSYDGIAEVWYDDVESMQRAFSSPEYARLLADEINFMGSATSDTVFLFVKEDELR